MSRHLSAIWYLCAALVASNSSAQAPTNAPDLISHERPFIAIWEDKPGHTFKQEAPYLRIAIWNDGSVLFAANPKSWSHGLRRGRISVEQVTRLKSAISASGVFDLKTTGIYPVCCPQDYILADLGAKQQLLSCAEVAWPHVKEREYQELRKCWYALDQIALSGRPDDFEAVDQRFRKAPPSWFLQERK